MKVIDVLGMHITDYSIKEAIGLAMKYTSNGVMNTIFYVSSQVLLEAGEDAQQKEWLESMDMLLYGEPTVLDVLGENTRERKHEIRQDMFLHAFIKKIARAGLKVYLVSDTADKMDPLERYLYDLHSNVKIVGKYLWNEADEPVENLINELNDASPDVVISKLPYLTQERLICENRKLINVNLWIALLHERVIDKKRKVQFGSKLDFMFYKRLFKRKVNKYETEKSESEKVEGIRTDSEH